MDRYYARIKLKSDDKKAAPKPYNMHDEGIMCKKESNYDNLLNFSALSVHRNAIYGFAALWIVLFHYTEMSKAKAAMIPKMGFFWDTLRLGNIGVDIFLLLSGIGLYYSFMKDGRILRFYCKRLVRIMVPYLLLCVPYMTYLLINGDFTIAKYIKQVTTVFYWTGDTSVLNLWYVPAVLALYLIYPLIYKVLFYKERNALLRCLILMAASIAITFCAALFFKDFYALYDKFLPRVTVFILGCYCGKPVKEKKSFSAWLIVAGLVILLFAYPLYAKGILRSVFSRYYGCLTGVMLAFLLSQLFELLKSILLGRIFAFFGAFSLEIYLAHIVVRNIYMRTSLYGDHLHLAYAAVALISLLIAYAASLIEKPIIRQLLKPLSKSKG